MMMVMMRRDYNPTQPASHCYSHISHVHPPHPMQLASYHISHVHHTASQPLLQPHPTVDTWIVPGQILTTYNPLDQGTWRAHIDDDDGLQSLGQSNEFK